jgi:glyoxylase-like metal-dependent hydrolase (beta-lactamase superfamily II)
VLQKLVSDMKQHLGMKQIDACWISHMHGDHFTLAPTLKEMGVELWTMDSIVDKCENPRAYDYPALIHAYGDGFDGIKIDRVLKAGDVIKWQGYSLHIDWMPGQTEFGNALWLELDGKKIVFSGDNLFGDPSDEKQDGHECVVARNSAIIDEGYLVAARYLKQLKPDIIMGAHSVLMTDPAAFVERFESWAERMIGRFKDMLPATNYEFLFDPHWVSAYPYRVDLTTQDSALVQITVRNFSHEPQPHEVRLALPPGIKALPPVIKGTVPAKGRQTFPVQLTVEDRSKTVPGVQIVPMDVALGERHFGQWFDFLLMTQKPTP